MKKIIALFVVMLAFGLNANAQQKKAAAATTQKTVQKSDATIQAAARDLTLLSETVELTEEQKGIYKRLFETKHHSLSDASLPQERKDRLAENVERKLKSVMTPDQVAKIDSNPELLKKLTH